MSRKVPPDWRIVKVDQTSTVLNSYRKARKITKCGTFYLIDVNLHVHICSLTPVHEAFPVQGYVEFETPEAEQADDGNSEMELIETEELVSYFYTSIANNPSKSAENYLPDREEDESDEDYYKRVPDAVREYLSGNPTWF